MRNLGKEHNNENYKEYSETTPEVNDSMKSKINNGITEKCFIISLLAKHFSLKIIKAVILFIDTYKQDLISVGNKNKRIQNKDKWNHLNHTPIQLLLGANHRLPLFHIDKSSIWIELKKECINKFLIGYMINPKLNINQGFRENINLGFR